ALAGRIRGPPWVPHAHVACQGRFWRKAMYALLARWKGGGVIFQIHPTAFWDFYVEGGPLRKWAIERSLRRADALIVISASVKAHLENIAPGVPLYLLPNPVDLAAMPQPGLRDPATIAFVGWRVPQKASSSS